MEPELERKILLDQFHSLIQILSDRGIAFEHPTDDEISKLSAADLARIVRTYRDLARTPI